MVYVDPFMPTITIRYVTYSYQEGLLTICGIFFLVLIVAFINMIISLMFGIRKNDCATILMTNIMVKTVMFSLYNLLDDFFYLGKFSTITLIACIVV